MAPDSLPEHARALNERLSTIYLRLLGTAAVSIVNASLIAFVVQRQGRGRAVATWLALVILLSIARTFAAWRYRQDDLKLDHGRLWARVSVTGSSCSGLLWGVGPIAAAGADPNHQWLWAFAIGGMCAGAASLHAAHLPTALSFIVPACLPLSAMLLLERSFAGTAAGVMSLAFIAMMTFTAVLFSQEFGRTLRLKFALERRAVELHGANRRLSREIEDHRATSEALHQSQKMEALGGLTGGFAHDFNNLLTVILGNLDMIMSRTKEGGVQALVRSALTAAESATNLTSRLLAFARKQALTPKLVDINQVVADFVGLLTRAVSGAIRIEFVFGAKEPIAPIDPTHFQAALLNLVVNARDAMPNGGLITVTTGKARLESEELLGTDARAGEFITVAVADDGAGMPPEVAARVFEPFFTTKGGSGSGLGLSQVYGFARQSGGFARIDSEQDVGTTATLYIPASDEALPAAAPPPPRDGAAADQPLSVLLVDDNPGVLAVLSAALSERGWTIATAGDGPSALALLENGPRRDIVVTDVDMPGALDGIQLEREIRGRWPELPVLLISGVPLPPAVIGPEVPFLVKPFRNQLFLSKIEALVYS